MQIKRNCRDLICNNFRCSFAIIIVTCCNCNKKRITFSLLRLCLLLIIIVSWRLYFILIFHLPIFEDCTWNFIVNIRVCEINMIKTSNPFYNQFNLQIRTIKNDRYKIMKIFAAYPICTIIVTTSFVAQSCKC